MTSGNRLATIVLILAAAIAGGATSHWLLSAGSAEAASPAETLKVGNPQWVRALKLWLVDEGNVTNRGILMIEGGSARLDLMNGQGDTRLMLEVAQAGQPRVSLLDSAGKERATMTVSADGNPTVRLAGARQSQLRLSVADGPRVDLIDAAGILRGQFGLDSAGTPGLKMFDSSGKPAWQAP